MVHPTSDNYSSITRIKRSIFQIKRKKDQKVIGEKISIMHGPSWLYRTISPMGGRICPDPKKKSSDNIAGAVFKKELE
jgi:hypothetical protein